MDDLLVDFPVVIEIPVAWGEMDAFQHVNNIVYLRYFESARIAYFERLGFIAVMEQTGIGPILAQLECRYRKPLTYPDTVSVGVRVSEMAKDRFTMQCRIVSHKLATVAAEAEATMVAYDYSQGQKTVVPDGVRRQIEALESGAKPH